MRRRPARPLAARRLAARLLAPSGLLGPVLTLASGAVAAQALAYAARPVLTRVFEPADFGLLGAYLAVVAVLATAATGQYENAIPLSMEDEEAAGALALAAGLSTAVALVALAMVPLREPAAALLRQPELAPYLALVPPGVWAAAWGRAGEVWLTRMHRYGAVAVSRLGQGGVMVPAQAGSGLRGAGAGGLIGGHLAGRVAGTLLLAGAALSGRGAPALRAAVGGSGRGGLGALARRYRRFPAFAMPSSLLNVLSTQLPALLLVALYPPEPAGYYLLAYGTLAVPMQLVGSSVGQVFFIRAAEADRAGALAPLTRRVWERLVALGLFPLAAAAAAGPEAFAFVFGPEWREAGVYARALAPWLFLVFVTSPVTALFDVLERQRAELGFNAALLVLRAAALGGGAILGGPRWSVALFGAVSAAVWAAKGLVVSRWGGLGGREAVRMLGRWALVAAGPLAAVGGATASGLADGAVVAVAAGAGLVYLSLAAWLLGREGSEA